MMSTKLFLKPAVLLMAFALALSAPAFAAQDRKPAPQEEKKEEKQAEKKDDKQEQKKDEKKEEKKEAMQQGTPVFWQEPTDISSRNLLAGPGGERFNSQLFFMDAPEPL